MDTLCSVERANPLCRTHSENQYGEKPSDLELRVGLEDSVLDHVHDPPKLPEFVLDKCSRQPNEHFRAPQLLYGLRPAPSKEGASAEPNKRHIGGHTGETNLRKTNATKKKDTHAREKYKKQTSMRATKKWAVATAYH